MSSLTIWDGNQYTLVAYTFIFVTIFVFSLLRISPHSINRIAAVVLLGALTYSFQITLAKWSNNRAVPSLFVSTAWTIFWNAFELLLVSKAGSEDVAEGRSFLGQIHLAASFLSNWRRIGTKWEISTIPKFSSGGRVPSRLRHAIRTTVIAGLCYLFVDLCAAGPPPDLEMFAPRKQLLFSRLSELSTEEVVLRLISTAVFLANAILGFIMFYNIVAAFCVISGMNTPAECPPMFGSIGEAYSLRGYWGTFYHQGLRKCITGPADFFVNDILKLSHGTRLSRYSRLTLAFAISGLIHHLTELTMGIPASEAGQFVYFTSQSFGILFEDAVSELYKRNPILKLPRKMEYAVGYFWVIAWLVWTTPSWFFPMIRHMDPERDTLVFGVFKKLFTGN